MTELPDPEAVNLVTPELAPRMVDAAVALTVSLGAAKIALDVVTVIEFPPLDVSATAVAPVIVSAVFAVARTAGPVTVEAPVAEKTVKLVPELKKLFRTAAAPPVNCCTTVAPLTVDPLMVSCPLPSAALEKFGAAKGARCHLLKCRGDFPVNETKVISQILPAVRCDSLFATAASGRSL